MVNQAQTVPPEIHCGNIFGGGNGVAMARTMIMALKGSAQQ
jgi:hypothetical protein